MSYYVKNPEVPNTYIQVGTEKYNDLLDRGVIDESVPRFKRYSKHDLSSKSQNLVKLNKSQAEYFEDNEDFIDAISNSTPEELEEISNAINFPLSLTCPKEGTIGTLNSDYTFYYKDKTGKHSLLVSPNDNKLEVFSYNSSWISGFFYNNNYCEPKRLFIKKINEDRDIIDGNNCMLVSHNAPRYPGFIKKYNTKNNYHYINILVALFLIIGTASNPIAAFDYSWYLIQSIIYILINLGYTGGYILNIMFIILQYLSYYNLIKNVIVMPIYTRIQQQMKNGGYLN